MDPALRHAWTAVISADDYETHMAAIGQAQAAASLTEWLLREARLAADSRITIAGAGTGQMFGFLDAALLLPHRLTCGDLNPAFLARLEMRLAEHGLKAEIVQDDLENTHLPPGSDLLLATLVLEHIDWRAGVRSICQLSPRMCGIIMQVNPPDMGSAVTPGRVLPPSMQAAAETWNPVLLPAGELIASFGMYGFSCRARNFINVADRKELQALPFAREGLRRVRDTRAGAVVIADGEGVAFHRAGKLASGSLERTIGLSSYRGRVKSDKPGIIRGLLCLVDPQQQR